MDEPADVATTPVERRGGLFHPLGVLVGKAVLRAPRLTPHLIGRDAPRRELAAAGATLHDATCDDGVSLAYAFVPPAAGEPRKPPVLYLHGWMETKEVHARPARLLADRGHPVILADLRAHGDSGGKFCTFGVRERHDADAVLDDAARRFDLEPPFVTVGFSTGAVTVLHHLAVDREGPPFHGQGRVAACCALAPMISFRGGVRWFRGMLAPQVAQKWLLLGCAGAIRRAGFTYNETDLRGVVADETRPVLFASGPLGSRWTLGDHVTELHRLKKHGWTDYVEVDAPTHFTVGVEAWDRILPAWDAMLGEIA